MKTPLLATAISIFSLLLSDTSSAAPFTNGSFEQPGITSGNEQVLAGGSTDVTGWTVNALPGTGGVYSAAGDFSDTLNNETRIWQYGYRIALQATDPTDLTRFDTHTPSGPVQLWYHSATGNVPTVYKNSGASDFNIGEGYLLGAGKTGCHPGASGEFAIFKWTAPAAGIYAIHADWLGLGSSSTVDVHVLINGLSNYNGNLVYEGALTGPNTTASYDSGTPFTLPAGTTVEFAVGRGSDNSYVGDSTGINATISELGSSSGMIWEKNGNSHGVTAQDGTHLVSFGHGGAHGDAISQTFDTVPGTSYNVSYQIAQTGSSGNDQQTMKVEAFSGSTLLATALSNTLPITQNQWAAGTIYTFLATSASTKLVFTDTTPQAGGGASDWALDHASVSATLVITNTDFPITGGQLNIVGGTGPYTVTLLSGSLPSGITISSSGLVSGTAANGSYTFTLHVVDSLGASSDRTFNVVVENTVSVPSALADWWPGEGAVGDIIGGYHGSLKNGATYGAGKVGRSFSFDGVDDFMDLPDSGAMNLAGDFTIEAWIKRTADSAGDTTIIGKRSGDNQNAPYHLLLKADGRLAFASRNAGVWTEAATSALLTLNAWNHVAASLTGGQVRLYVNGQLSQTAAHSVTRPAVIEPATVGATVTTANPAVNPLNPFTGLIDELSLYSRALTLSEINGIYLAGDTGKTRHDVARDYSATTNNGPVWSYRWLPNTDVNTAYDPAAANANLLSGPNPTDPNNGISYWDIPAWVFYNTTDVFYGTWAPRQFSTHPGGSGEYAIARWKAPHAGQFAVSGTFYGADPAPSTTDVHIFHNATQLSPTGKRTVNSFRGDGVSHTQIITVAANDTVDFLVGAGGNGNGSDHTGLAASIVEVAPAAGPEIDIEQPVGTHLVDDGSTVNFETTPVLTPVTRTFTITNTGTVELTLTAPSPSGDFTPGAFGDATLDPAQSTTLTVTFTPSEAGARTGTLHIGSNDADESPFDISLAGTGSGSSGNAIFGWGDGASAGIGDGTTTTRFTPVPTIMTGALANKGVVSVVAGTGQSLALSDDGKIFAWGLNDFGELGDGTTTFRNEPVAVNMSDALNGKVVTACAAGLQYSLALTSEGKVYSWGFNGFGQLGLGDTNPRSTPQLVQGLLTGKIVIAISAGAYHAMALTSDGLVFGWGANSSGELGDGSTTTRLSPVALVKTGTLIASKTISSILCSSNHTFVRTSDNLLFSWGWNGNGELGDGTTTDRLLPVAINGALAGKSVVEIAGNNSSHLARTSDGLLYAWGINLHGELGDGTTTTRPAPVPVEMSGALNGKTVVSIHAGGGSSLARTNDNHLYSWGGNQVGQLGVGTGPTESHVPVAVSATGALAGRTLITCSIQGYHALVITYMPPTPDINIVSSGNITYADGGNRDFGTLFVGNATIPTIFTIQNVGTATLTGFSGAEGITIDGPNAGAFLLSGPGATSLAPGASVTISISFVPQGQGAHTAALHIHSNDPDEEPFDITLTGAGGVPITDWRQQYFGTSSNTGNAADDADPDHDGISNLLEFATAGAPNTNSPAPTSITPPGGSFIEFFYTRNKLAMAELTYEVQWTDDLLTAWSTAGVTETILSDNGTVQQVKALVPTGGNGHRFVHLEVTRL